MLSDLSNAAADMDGDTNTFSSPKQANNSRSERLRQISRNLGTISGKFYASISDESNANATHTCLNSSVSNQIDQIGNIADWIRSSPIALLEKIKANAAPTGNLLEGWKKLDELSEVAADLPTMKQEWAGNVSRLRSIQNAIRSAVKKCDDPEDDPEDDEDRQYGDECDRIASALEKLAECAPKKDDNNDGDGDGEEGNLSDRLDKLERKLDRVCELLGDADFPVKVPECLTDEKEKIVEKTNLPQLISWQTLQLDALMGQFPICIKIKDADLDEEGDQEREIKIPNIAEGLAELLGQAASGAIIGGTTLNVATRCLIEAGYAKKIATQNYFYHEATADYMGYEIEEGYEPVAFSFDPCQVEDLEKALQATEQPVPCVRFKQKDNNDLPATLEQLLRAAAIIHGVFFNPVNPNNPKGTFKQDLTALDREDESEFDDFTRDTEKGFTGKAGIRDADNPWGRPYEQRPRIREIGSDGDAREDISK
ncbi:MAG: hypothetical protein SAJ12_09000 [Jaaginema sp. PMC 1079.18]|nr:hypothetical protein [Jaaginema sp. PMC 1080.18]MEC4851138.1 hypothetical protein [Jaaginema sp. PMC 1079.18]